MHDGSELAPATAEAGAVGELLIDPAGLDADGPMSPLAAEPGAQAAATADTETAPISASTSRRLSNRPISRSSSSGSIGRWKTASGVLRSRSFVRLWVGVIARLQLRSGSADRHRAS